MKKLVITQARQRLTPLLATIIGAGMAFVVISLFMLPLDNLVIIGIAGWAMTLGLWVLYYYMQKAMILLYNQLKISDAILAEIHSESARILKEYKKGAEE